MSGSLQAKMYGGSRFGSSTTKRMGSYNQGAMKRLGHSNGTIKRLGQNHGASYIGLLNSFTNLKFKELNDVFTIL